MSPNAPGIVHVTRINHESHVSQQARYLLKLEDDSWRSAYCTGRFMCCDNHIARINTFQYEVKFVVRSITL